MSVPFKNGPAFKWLGFRKNKRRTIFYNFFKTNSPDQDPAGLKEEDTYRMNREDGQKIQTLRYLFETS